jgi:hypothetical protein
MERDRKIADSGWGIKPDDQPANAAEARGEDAVHAYRYSADEPDVVRKILRAQRRGFNAANAVRVEAGRTFIIDINKDEFLVDGLSWGDANMIALLEALGAAFNPQEVKQFGEKTPPRTFALGRAWAWGAERTG